MAVTRKDCIGWMDGRSFAVPKGTVVKKYDVTGPNRYAVESEAVVRKITNDPHCAKYYHLWVPSEAVEFFPKENLE